MVVLCKTSHMRYFVYIMASKKNGTLYVGVTSDIVKRVYEHKMSFDETSFTGRYGVTLLVYLEMYSDINEAIKREKRMKKWKRGWKIDLIKKSNPEWRDLYQEIIRCGY